MFVNYEAQGNLQSTHSIDCVKITRLTNQDTPADILPAVRRCIKSSRYERAVDLIIVALAYGRFDMARVADKSAHQAITALQIINLNSLDKSKQTKFQDAVRYRYSKGVEDMARVCGTLESLGPRTTNQSICSGTV